ncbi:hypothetical protein ES708_00736 [subsurface metagenome]
MTLPFVGTITKIGMVYDIEYDMDYRIQAHLAKIGEGKRVRTTVRKYYKKNTPEQRAYLFSVIVPLITALRKYKRHARDHVYNVLKHEYLTSTDSHGSTYIVQLREDSDDPADVAMVAFFIEQIKDEAAMQYGYPIPDADKNYNKGEIEDMITEIERG